MKWWILGFSAVAGVLVGVAMMPRSTAQQATRAPESARPTRSITASGTGTVKVKPDTVRITFGVMNTGTDSKAVLEENQKRARKVQSAIEALKIDDLTIATAPVSVQVTPEVELPVAPGGPDKPVGPGVGAPPVPAKISSTYEATRSFGVTIRNADSEKLSASADRVLGVLLGAGVNTSSAYPGNGGQFGGQIGGIGGIGGFQGFGPQRSGLKAEYFYDDVTKARRQAIVKAVEDAHENARTAAGPARLTVQDTLTVSDQPAQLGGFGAFGIAGGIGGFGGGYTPTRTEINGETEITVQVVVTFSCEAK